ncbi:uncharacterized protein N7483_012486 [Penicillium malachiteum]|uniref:uncharacterized protein n=1 Tax=Penicillium malachiteum TaxID=1324776 RepID=UPI00254882C3|nr:uncharacterized protein N7483_012486 [Penicillium malachiteum]KAJ5715305.1 hypothetical protein N7483_012486 [Penicillium malachiteum]
MYLCYQIQGLSFFTCGETYEIIVSPTPLVKPSMFSRFSATPAKARGRAKGSGSELARSTNKTHQESRNSGYVASPDHKVLSLAKRQKAARACDRCRIHRTKCDEQKPCTQCSSIKAECIVSYGPPRSTQVDNSNGGHARPVPESVAHQTFSFPSPTGTPFQYHDLNNASGSTAHTNQTSPHVPPASTTSPQQSLWATNTPPETVPDEIFNVAHLHGFFDSGQPAPSSSSASAGCLFHQLPYSAVPSGICLLSSNPLLRTQRSYYLRLFWDTCHPLLFIMNEMQFAELDSLSPPTISDKYSAGHALVDSMLALGIQHSHTTGLAGRILGAQQPSTEAGWPGFEYFDRCRECMRANTQVTLDILRCHSLMIVYLMKGNAFRDSYSLLGITIRKAYIAKLSRPPPSHLPECEKTAHMQLWWMLFCLDLQCSLQLDMPTASQESLVKCPLPTEDALNRYISCPGHLEESVSPYIYTTCLMNLALIVADIAACFLAADLDEDDTGSPAALEQHALKLSSTLQRLEIWHDHLPSEVRLAQGGRGFVDPEVLDFVPDPSLPVWLQRQRVLLELHYHNTYNLIQRPFICIRYTHSSVPNGVATPLDTRQPQTELHMSSALHHSIMVVDKVFTICSTSELLYGWSEVLQPLWNATLTIMAYVYAKTLSFEVPRALESLKRAQAVIESFSSTSLSARSVKNVINSLVSSLQSMSAQGPATAPNEDVMGWDIFTSLLERQSCPSALDTTLHPTISTVECSSHP